MAISTGLASAGELRFGITSACMSPRRGAGGSAGRGLMSVSEGVSGAGREASGAEIAARASGPGSFVAGACCRAMSSGFCGAATVVSTGRSSSLGWGLARGAIT